MSTTTDDPKNKASIVDGDVTPTTTSPHQSARTIEVVAMFPIVVEYNGAKIELHYNGTATGDIDALEVALSTMQRVPDGVGSIVMWLVLNAMRGQKK